MSETMVRKQVYIRRDQDERLKAAAAATGKTESEIIRGAVDATVGSLQVPSRWPVEQRARAMEESEHAKRRRGWRREDIYWERMTYAQRIEEEDRAWIRRFLDGLPAPTSAQSTRAGFDREEAYAERLRRLFD